MKAKRKKVKLPSVVPCPRCGGAGKVRVQSVTVGGHRLTYNGYCGTCLGCKVVTKEAAKILRMAKKNPPKDHRKTCPSCKKLIDSYWSQTDEVRKYCFHDDRTGAKCKLSGKKIKRS